jgi:acetyltransferase
VTAFAGTIQRTADGRAVAVRPARAADRDAVQRFVQALSPLARRRRFFGAVSELAPDQLDRLTQVRDPREIALVALAHAPEGARVVAMAQCADADAAEGEIAVVVADAWQRQKLGARLVDMLTAHAAASGIATLHAEVLAENWPMLALLAGRGFELEDYPGPQIVRARRVVPPGVAGLVSQLVGVAAGAMTRTARLLGAG